jgi:co-chaperonin GroES (HSP10)
VRPLRDKVLVRILPGPRPGGLVLPEESPEYGVVMAAGPEVRELLPGDLVYFPSSVGHTYRISQADYLFIPEKEVWLRVEDARYGA